MIQKQKKKLDNPTVSLTVGLSGIREECAIKVSGEGVGTIELILPAKAVY